MDLLQCIGPSSQDLRGWLEEFPASREALGTATRGITIEALSSHLGIPILTPSSHDAHNLHKLSQGYAFAGLENVQNLWLEDVI